MKKTLILVSLLAIFLCGCASKTPEDNRTIIDSKQIDASDPRIMVIYGNKEFNDKLFVIRKIIDDSNTLTKCSVTLQNDSDATFFVEYQFRWLEASGMPVMQTPAWSRATIAPHSIIPLVNLAKTPEAHQVEFTIRLPLSGIYEKPKSK